jgi:hypothetical protein
MCWGIRIVLINDNDNDFTQPNHGQSKTQAPVAISKVAKPVIREEGTNPQMKELSPHQSRDDETEPGCNPVI